MMLSPREKELHQAWLHYREIGDEKRKMEAMSQLIHFINRKEVES